MSATQTHAPHAPAAQPLGAPPFAIGDVVFESWWVGDAGGHPEWRSTCGRLVAGRTTVPARYPEAGATMVHAWWAALDGKRSLAGYATSIGAMTAAITALARKRFGPPEPPALQAPDESPRLALPAPERPTQARKTA
jgi:hypothetical protein